MALEAVMGGGFLGANEPQAAKLKLAYQRRPGIRGGAPCVECLSRMCETLSSEPSTTYTRHPGELPVMEVPERAVRRIRSEKKVVKMEEG